MRRKFYELAAAGPASIATEALERIKAIYAVEANIRGKDPDVGCPIRSDQSRPLIEALEPWLRARLETISQGTKPAEAVRYALSCWPGVSLFFDDGQIELDNNTVERAIRPLALNRNNPLFAGSDAGGEHWAALASVIGTAKLNNVDPEG